jgi:hypothetical protein
MFEKKRGGVRGNRDLSGTHFHKPMRDFQKPGPRAIGFGPRNIAFARHFFFSQSER